MQQVILFSKNIKVENEKIKAEFKKMTECFSMYCMHHYGNVCHSALQIMAGPTLWHPGYMSLYQKAQTVLSKVRNSLNSDQIH